MVDCADGDSDSPAASADHEMRQARLHESLLRLLRARQASTGCDHAGRRPDERWQEIEHEVLGERDIETRQIQQRLTLNAEDNDFFRSLTLETPQNRNIAPTLASHQRLLKAHDLFSAKFAALIDGLGPDKWQQPLLAWYSFILTKAQVIEVLSLIHI